MSTIRLAVTSVMAGVLLLLSACGGAAPSLGGAESNAQTALCQPLAAVRTATAKLSDINAETSLNDIKSAKEGVDKLVEALRAANGVLQRPAINDLLTQYDSFSAQLAGLTSQEQLGPALDNLRASVSGVNAALDQANSTLGCP